VEGQPAGSPADALEALQRTLEGAARSPLYAERLRGVKLGALEDLRKLPLTSRGDLVAAGLGGTRAAPLEEICHYGESSGTTGQRNSTWLTAADLDRSAQRIAERHPDLFAPGRILMNRFPFMAAPAHLIQLIAQRGNGVAIPAGNINWDVPYPEALSLAERTGANTLAGFPNEPVVLARLAQERGLDVRKDLSIDSFLLGGGALPRVMQERIERDWGARVVELYGSTETMLLGTGCAARSLHLETDLAYCEFLCVDSDEPAAVGKESRLVVTTCGIEGSPLVRLDTGDRVRQLPPCPCGDPRPSVVVMGRENDIVELGDRRFHTYDLIEAGAAAANELDSAVFFVVVLPDRLVLRIEAGPRSVGDPHATAREYLGDVEIEIEQTKPMMLLDVESLSRSPSVYKPVLVSDWRRPGRKLISVSQGMIEWPRPSLAELSRLVGRTVRGTLRGRSLRRALRSGSKRVR
jgi:phenylacetate-CoA ligase